MLSFVTLCLVALSTSALAIDPLKCAADSDKLQSSQFASCQDILFKIDDLTYKSAEAADFCNKNCHTLIADLAPKLVQDCGYPPDAFVSFFL